MVRIVFLGPPGCGKGTQSNLIADQYKVPNIAAGEILRRSFLDNQLDLQYKNINNNTDIINSGNLINDELAIKLIIERINQNDCKNGFLLDGFPRTIKQAMSIKQNNVLINFVIEFRVPDSIIIDRIVGRQIHTKSGRIYHVKFNPPKNIGLDDLTGDQLTTRLDDAEDIIQQRLNQYYQHTLPLSDYYQKQSQKGRIRYFIVDGNRSINKINQELNKIFQSYLTTSNKAT